MPGYSNVVIPNKGFNTIFYQFLAIFRKRYMIETCVTVES